MKFNFSKKEDDDDDKEENGNGDMSEMFSQDELDRINKIVESWE